MKAEKNVFLPVVVFTELNYLGLGIWAEEISAFFSQYNGTRWNFAFQALSGPKYILFLRTMTQLLKDKSTSLLLSVFKDLFSFHITPVWTCTYYTAVPTTLLIFYYLSYFILSYLMHASSFLLILLCYLLHQITEGNS